MSQPGNFEIDVDRRFPHLPNAPIVEAVIHWQAAPTNVLDREELQQELERRFSGYFICVQQKVEAALSASAEGVESRHKTRWGGFRLTSADQMHVCQITPNAVAFSRLAPYEVIRFRERPPGLPEAIGLRPETFFRLDTMEVPDCPYRVNLVRTIQGAQPPIAPRRSLILDIDVFTTESTNVDTAAVEQRLDDMRFLKNFVFFNFVKDAENRFGGPKK